MFYLVTTQHYHIYFPFFCTLPTMYAYLLEFVAFVIERKLSLASAIFPMKFERFRHWIRSKEIYGNWDNCKDVWKTGAFTIGSRREDGAVKLPVFRTYRSHDADVGKTETVFVGYTAPVFARYS